jgi:hypothetical protein
MSRECGTRRSHIVTKIRQYTRRESINELYISGRMRRRHCHVLERQWAQVGRAMEVGGGKKRCTAAVTIIGLISP